MAELHDEGGDEINPRFPNFAPEWLRLRPSHIVSWGVDGSGEFKPYSRPVGVQPSQCAAVTPSRIRRDTTDDDPPGSMVTP